METTQTQATASNAVADTTEKLSQIDAVYKYVLETLTDKRSEGTKLRDVVTKEVRKQVRQKLYDAFKAGTVKLSKPMDDNKLKKYCSGLINNWVKKDDRYNA